MKSIWDGSFKGCTDLQSITVDAGNSIFFSKDGILYDKVYKTYGGEVIGNNICCYPAGKSWAGSYTLPSDVVLLSGFAFDSCKFTEIHIPARVLDLDRKQQIEGAQIFPVEYFNPYDDPTGRLNKTTKTYSIHWFAKSWMGKKEILRSQILKPVHRIFGKDVFRRGK